MLRLRLDRRGAPLPPAIRRTLGQHLRETYASLDEEQPDRFAVLLARLEAVLAARGETLTAEVRQGLQDHAAGLRKYALSLTRDAARADDLVQDTMLRAWMYRESFTPGTNVCGWLTIIMRNTFYSGQRKRVHEVEDTRWQLRGATGHPAGPGRRPRPGGRERRHRPAVDAPCARR